MTRYPCSGCGLHSCDGRCFTECAADYAQAEEGDTGITLDELRQRYGAWASDEGDPLLKAKRRRAA